MEPLEILVGDDQPHVCEALKLLLKNAGHHAETVDSPEAILEAARRNNFDIILMDLNYTRDTTSGREGLDLLSELQARKVAAPVVVMTAWGDVELAVEAMRRGASDFVQKPWDNSRLLLTLERQAREGRRRRENAGAQQRDMERARDIQRKLLPPDGNGLKTLRYAASCEPAREVGGDYYDFLPIGPGRMAFIVADVSGKGVSAALLMAHLRACFHSLGPEEFEDAAAVLARMNRLFWQATSDEHFCTLFYADYDDVTRKLRYVNCGHPSAVLLRCDGAVETLAPTATLFGFLESLPLDVEEVQLRPGDALAVFSDGISEAATATGEEFGEGRVVEALRACGACPGGLLASVHAFSHTEQADDQTVLTMHAC